MRSEREHLPESPNKSVAAAADGVAYHPVMMLWSPELAVVPVTIHLPLKDVISRLTGDLVVETGRIVARDLRDRFGIARPRLVVAGLNPHAGEAALGDGSEPGTPRGRAASKRTASTHAVRFPPTRCSTRRLGRATTRRWRCITTRRSSRSRRSPSITR
jgi:hypothetical protein